MTKMTATTKQKREAITTDNEQSDKDNNLGSQGKDDNHKRGHKVNDDDDDDDDDNDNDDRNRRSRR